jgi:hypothetical protein
MASGENVRVPGWIWALPGRGHKEAPADVAKRAIRVRRSITGEVYAWCDRGRAEDGGR